VFSGGNPAQLRLHADAFAFLTLLTAIAFSAHEGAPRVKVGVALLALPGALHAFGSSRRAWRPRPQRVASVRARCRRRARAVAAGAIGVLLAGMLAPFLLPPRPLRERRWHVPLAIAPR
jgi:hypothetical protein